MWATVVCFLGVSSIVSHPMTNSKWVSTVLCFCAKQSHYLCLTSHDHCSQWVTPVHFFARQSHQSCLPCPTVCECQWISLPGSLINHVSSHDQQQVSDIALCVCQAASSHDQLQQVSDIARQSHQSCLIPWPTASELHCFISLCQAVSSIMSLPLLNRL